MNLLARLHADPRQVGQVKVAKEINGVHPIPWRLPSVKTSPITPDQHTDLVWFVLLILLKPPLPTLSSTLTAVTETSWALHADVALGAPAGTRYIRYMVPSYKALKVALARIHAISETYGAQLAQLEAQQLSEPRGEREREGDSL